MADTSGGSLPSGWQTSMTFSTLIKNYIKLQSSVVQSVRSVASNNSTATPGKFLLLQFQMSQVTQVGEAISNIIMQVSGVIKNSVSNMKQ